MRPPSPAPPWTSNPHPSSTTQPPDASPQSTNPTDIHTQRARNPHTATQTFAPPPLSRTSTPRPPATPDVRCQGSPTLSACGAGRSGACSGGCPSPLKIPPPSQDRPPPLLKRTLPSATSPVVHLHKNRNGSPRSGPRIATHMTPPDRRRSHKPAHGPCLIVTPDPGSASPPPAPDPTHARTPALPR